MSNGVKKDTTEYILFPMGIYYIGDLAYVIKNKNWNKFVDKMENSPRLRNGKGKCVYNKHEFWWHETFWGHGNTIVEDNLKNEYTIVTDSLGICPIEMVERKFKKETEKCYILAFTEDFYVRYDCGIFEFGDIIINSMM